jgi:hypothetical protein
MLCIPFYLIMGNYIHTQVILTTKYGHNIITFYSNWKYTETISFEHNETIRTY